MLFITTTLAVVEMWWNVEGTKFGFDRVFRLNLENQAKLPNNNEKKNKLIEYFRFNKRAIYDLYDHNSRTDFHPKHLEERVIIPYDTHIMWVTQPQKKKIMSFPNIWDMVYKMGEENRKYGVNWQHYFWTNEKSAVKLNETACGGRCHIKLFKELPNFNQVEFLVD
jgi:hypothetical protein